MNDVSKLARIMAQKDIAQEHELIGISLSEMLTLEEYFGLVFPQAYRTFLKQFGRSAGLLSPWMAMYFDDLKEIRETFDIQAKQLKKAPRLPRKALLISHWESVYDFIICGKDQDPEVFRIDLTQGGKPKLHSPSYSQYLLTLVENASPAPRLGELGVDECLLPNDSIQY